MCRAHRCLGWLHRPERELAACPPPPVVLLFFLTRLGRVCDDADATLAAATDTAKLIASKSPIAVVGTKVNLNFSRDRSTADGLE